MELLLKMSQTGVNITWELVRKAELQNPPADWLIQNLHFNRIPAHLDPIIMFLSTLTLSGFSVTFCLWTFKDLIPSAGIFWDTLKVRYSIWSFLLGRALNHSAGFLWDLSSCLLTSCSSMSIFVSKRKKISGIWKAIHTVKGGSDYVSLFCNTLYWINVKWK